MVTIVLVLKVGGEYTLTHVSDLVRNIRAFAPKSGWAVKVLTDGCRFSADHAFGGEIARSIPLTEGWPGWWSKFEMFLLPGPCVYMDLDTVIVSPIAWLLQLAREHEFTMLRDAYRGRTNPDARQSSVMTWSGDMTRLYSGFKLYGPGGHRGDQEWIEASETPTPPALQDLAPGKLASFKVDCKSGPAPAGASIVYFHGRPRPWEQGVIPYGDRQQI